jgi:hypothetical protein
MSIFNMLKKITPKFTTKSRTEIKW